MTNERASIAKARRKAKSSIAGVPVP